ncbi:hypothetical protein M2284_000330 [Rhodococcus sp. LBL1]|uniref:Secreted protein n=2 Tax=Prescottella agglutinans TaxID=1644129 RepID=A0ABT6MGT3_9NOCA|nr:hypothetical protein [Prescottella agglutinans]MDH6676142.1 hypothetical protein [Rhodococcus sp. LBL1]MDH6681428.1 hypothetical protein [Rhodococcus sp. LBL2]
MMTTLAWDLLAQGTSTPSSPQGPEFGKASPLGLVLVVALLAGTILLVRSMNKQLRKLPDTFQPEHPEADQAADEGTERGAAIAEVIEPEQPAGGSQEQDPPTKPTS